MTLRFVGRLLSSFLDVARPMTLTAESKVTPQTIPIYSLNAVPKTMSSHIQGECVAMQEAET